MVMNSMPIPITSLAHTALTGVASDQHHAADLPGTAKAWCMVSLAGVLLAPNHNIDSVTDTGTGDRTVIFTVDFATQQYSCYGLSDVNGISVYAERTAVGSSRFVVGNNAATPALTDAYTGMVYFGLQ